MVATSRLGTWSGGRFMHFGEPLDDERLAALLRPDERIRTLMTADAYGAGEADALLGRAPVGGGARPVRTGRSDRARLLRGRARRAAGLSPLHRSAPARAGGLPRLRAHRRRAQPRALRRRSLRPAPAPQPRPPRLRVTRRLGRAARGPRRGPRRRPRGRARARERLHARPDRLLRALRRADRLGDADPEPARALARRSWRSPRPPGTT